MTNVTESYTKWGSFHISVQQHLNETQNVVSIYRKCTVPGYRLSISVFESKDSPTLCLTSESFVS